MTRAPRYLLGAADEALLHAAGRYQYLTIKQFARLLYTPDSGDHVQERAKPLFEAQLLNRKPLPTDWERGSNLYVYTLSARATRMFAELGMVFPQAHAPSKLARQTRSYLSHTLAVNDALIAFETLPRYEPRVGVAQLYHDRELRRRPVAVVLTDRRATKVTPGGWVELHVDGRYQDCFWLEVDRGTEDREAWQGKIRAILAATGGPYEQAFGTEIVTVAVVAAQDQSLLTPPGRARQLKTWTEAVLRTMPDYADLFRFASADPAVDQVGFLLDNHWERPFDDTRYPLVGLVGDDS